MRAFLLTSAAVTFLLFAGMAYLIFGPQPELSESRVVLIIDTGQSPVSARASVESAPPSADTTRLLSLRDTPRPQASADTNRDADARTADDSDIEAVIAARLEAQSAARRAREQAEARPEAVGDTAARRDAAPSPFDNLTTIEAPQQVVSVTQLLAAQVASENRPATAAAVEEPAATIAPPAEIDLELPPEPEDTASSTPVATEDATSQPPVATGATVAALPSASAAQETREQPSSPAEQIGSFSTGTEPAAEASIITAALPSMPVRRPAMRPRARIALMIRGLGVDETVTQQAVQQLPREVALAFVPYGNDLPAWAKRAREQRHEVLVQIPLEPEDYPTTNPGPHTLLTSISTRENLEHLDWLLDRFEDITGVTNYLGERLAERPDVFGPILLELKARGLVYVDDGKAYNPATREMARQIAMPYTVANIVIDTDRSPEAVRAALDKLAETAKSEGSAIGIGHAFPDTLEAVQAWLKELDPQDYVLLPVRRLAGS